MNYNGVITVDGVDYMRDAKGRLVPTAMVSDHDELRDELVRALFGRAETLNAELRQFKVDALADISAFVDLSAERYNVSVGGKKGNIQLTTIDGELKVEVQVADRLGVDERIYAAKKIVHECLKNWSKKADPNLKSLVGHAFQVDKAGKLSIARLIELTRWPITDERWQEGMQAIRESINAVATATYVRCYRRDEHGKWRGVSLSISQV